MSEPPATATTPTRTCRVCGATYPATTEFFVGNKGSLYGVDRICWDCKRAAHQKYREENRELLREKNQRYREENREVLREKQRQFVAKNPDKIRQSQQKHYEKNREKIQEKDRQRYYKNHEREIERMRIYREEHREEKRESERRRYHENSEEEREHLRAVKREWKAKNRDKIREGNQRWRKENPHKKAVAQHRWKARRRGLEDTLTAEEWKVALDYFGGRCAYCGQVGELSQDHYVPLSDPDCPGTVVRNILPACIGCNSSKKNLQPSQWLRRKFGNQSAEIERRIYGYFEQIENARKIK